MTIYQSVLEERIIEERDRRLADGEDRDPLCVIADKLEYGSTVEPWIIEFVWDAHHYGPWVVNSLEKLGVYYELCQQSGFPLDMSSTFIEVNGTRVYQNDLGDCVFAESASGNRYAVWTHKGRIYIGFKDEADAIAFRTLNDAYSMDYTGNRHLGMVVLEGWDDPERINQVTADLAGH